MNKKPVRIILTSLLALAYIFNGRTKPLTAIMIVGVFVIFTYVSMKFYYSLHEGLAKLFGAIAIILWISISITMSLSIENLLPIKIESNLIELIVVIVYFYAASFLIDLFENKDSQK